MIHQYKLNGYNIVLDTASGSVHSVDEVAYDIIENYKSKSTDEIISLITEKYNVTKDEVLECIKDVKYLEGEGKLWSKDEYEDLAIDFKKRNTVVKALCLHIAHSCNLNCSYCFAAQGKYHGEDSLMSFETGKRALDFLIENSGTRRNLEKLKYPLQLAKASSSTSLHANLLRVQTSFLKQAYASWSVT